MTLLVKKKILGQIDTYDDRLSTSYGTQISCALINSIKLSRSVGTDYMEMPDIKGLYKISIFIVGNHQ